jgi:hypothetical protein
MSDQASLARENARLTAQLKRLQSVVSTLRDEVADANAEIAASRRLFDEQKEILMQEIERERAWRESVVSHVSVNSVQKFSVGTNTMMDSHTSTVADAATMTPSVSSPPPSKQNALSVKVNRSSHSGSPIALQRKMSPLQDFADWLSRGTNYRGRDLCAMFDAMGASSVDEVCANVTEEDLVRCGIPLLKARGMMHLIMEQTAVLLAQRK